MPDDTANHDITKILGREGDPDTTNLSGESAAEAADIQGILSREHLDGQGTLTQQVYRLMKRLIIELRLKPNQFLSEKDVALNLEVSKTPVREAFIRLSEDGMLLVVPQSGTYVSPIDIRRASEGYFVWSALESACASQVAIRRTVEDLHHLKELVEEQREALEDGDYPAFYVADDRFHEAMFRIAGYPNTRHLIDAAKFEVDRIRSLKKMYRLKPVAAVREEHVDILDAIARGDADLASKRMAGHLSRVNASLVELVRDEELWEMFNSLNRNGRGRRRRGNGPPRDNDAGQ